MSNFIKESRNFADYKNHIDQDGDLDPQYALNRNVALTGKFIDGEFITENKKHFKALIKCGKSGCPICNGIFKDLPNNNYNIKKFYVDKVIVANKLNREKSRDLENWLDKPNSQVNALEQIFAISRRRRKENKDNHPLLKYIEDKFTNKES